jgi:hypothetical protein
MTQSPVIYIARHVSVHGANIMSNGDVIFESPTPIAEAAVLGDRILIVLSVAGRENDPSFVGTNLWCIDRHGKMLWKAPDLNAHRPSRPAELSYRNICIYDQKIPAIHSSTGDRSWSDNDIETGKALQRSPDLDWSSPATAMAKLREFTTYVEMTTYIASTKILQVQTGEPIARPHFSGLELGG